MNGQEVAAIMDVEARASLDGNKSREQLLIKLNVFDIAFHNFEAVQMEHEETKENIKDGRFSFVPFPCGFFVDLLLDIFFLLGQDRSKKFLDVGCGLGSKVMLASVLFDAYGIEYDERQVSIANNLNIKRVGKADGMTFDKYDEFDVIYYFRPIHDKEQYKLFETNIHQKMKPGALVVPMHTEYNWLDQPDIEVMISKPFNAVYRKKI